MEDLELRFKQVINTSTELTELTKAHAEKLQKQFQDEWVNPYANQAPKEQTEETLDVQDLLVRARDKQRWQDALKTMAPQLKQLLYGSDKTKFDQQ